MTEEPLTADAFGPLAREHIEHPRNLGPLPDAETGPIATGEAGSTVSGDFVRFRVAVRAGRVAAVRYEVLGPPALIAAASYLSERLVGIAADPHAVPSGLGLAERLGLPRAQHGAALLAEDAARRALTCFARERPGGKNAG